MRAQRASSWRGTIATALVMAAIVGILLSVSLQPTGRAVCEQWTTEKTGPLSQTQTCTRWAFK